MGYNKKSYKKRSSKKKGRGKRLTSYRMSRGGRKLTS